MNQMSYFGPAAVAQLTGLSAGSTCQQLSRWEKSGEILRLKRGSYITEKFYLTHKEDERFPAFVSGVVEPFSYLSREYVLARYGVLTEATYPVTAVTSKNTKRISNLTGQYHYYHLTERLWGGYREASCWGVRCREASLAKALFDYLYGRKIRVKGLVEEERLNIGDWGSGLRDEFADWVLRAGSAKMRRVLAELERTVWS